jgi:hypothetical protein
MDMERLYNQSSEELPTNAFLMLYGSFKGLICDGFHNGSEAGLNNRRIDTRANEASLFGILGYTTAL